MALEKIGVQAVLETAEFVAGLRVYTNGLNTMENATAKAGQSVVASTSKMSAGWRDNANVLDRTGRQTMIGVRAISEAMTAIGLPPGIIEATRGAGQMADTIGDLGGIVADISPTMIALGVAAVGIAVAVYAANEASKQNAKFVKDLVQPYEDLYQAIKKLNAEKKLEKEIGFDTAALMAFGKTSEQAGAQVETLLRQRKELAELEAKKALWKSFEDGTIASKWRAGVAGIEGVWADLGAFLEGKVSPDSLNFSKLEDAIAAKRASISANTSPIDAGLLSNILAAQAKANTEARIKTQEGLWKAYVTSFQAIGGQIATIEQNLADQSVAIETARATQVSNIREQLGKTLASMARDYGRQIAGFAKQEIQIHADAGKAIADIEKNTRKQIEQIDKDSAKSLAQVTIDEAKSLAAVDAGLKKSIRSATTARQRRELRLDAADRKKEIVQQAADRRAEIITQANERKAQIIEARNERLADIALQRAERLQALAEQKQAAAEEHAYRVKEAQAAAAAQIQIANNAAAEQTRIAKDKAAKDEQILRDSLRKQERDVTNSMLVLKNLAATAGASVGAAFGDAFAVNAGGRINAEVLRISNILKQLQDWMKLIGGGASAPKGTTGVSSAVPTAAPITQRVTTSTSSNSKTINVTVPVTGSFDGMNQASVSAIAQQIADRTVAAVLSAA